eukprot:4860137-Pyramimonas_sp.AAC.1
MAGGVFVAGTYRIYPGSEPTARVEREYTQGVSQSCVTGENICCAPRGSASGRTHSTAMPPPNN